jgi:hypothetical protein
MQIDIPEGVEISETLRRHPAVIDTCDKCDKFPVCCIFRDFGKVIVENYGNSEEARKKYPVNPFHLAQICSMYHKKRDIDEETDPSLRFKKVNHK